MGKAKNLNFSFTAVNNCMKYTDMHLWYNIISFYAVFLIPRDAMMPRKSKRSYTVFRDDFNSFNRGSYHVEVSAWGGGVSFFFHPGELLFLTQDNWVKFYRPKVTSELHLLSYWYRNDIIYTRVDFIFMGLLKGLQIFEQGGIFIVPQLPEPPF